MTCVGTRVWVTDATGPSEGRRVALMLARRIGFDDTGTGKVAIAITEIASNLLKHAGRGEIVLRVVDEGGAAALHCLALDKGPGMSNVMASMRDGVSTAGSPGTGLGAIGRLSDAFHIYSQPGKGTAALVRFGACPPGEMEIDGFSVPVDGETLSGDGWGYHAAADHAVVFLVDGLGHGPLAESAARESLAAFERNPELPPATLLEAVHQAARATRGAAAAVARIDRDARLVRFAGIGNISGTLIAGGQTRHMVSMNGIVGHEARFFREFTYPWREDCLMIMHSDGLGTHWDFDAYPGLAPKPCALIAGVLYRDWGRARDDATCVVARARRPE